MKKILLLAYFIIFSINLSAQKFNIEEMNYSNVNMIDSLKKDEIYIGAKVFLTEIFNSAKDVMQLDDKESGIIICKGIKEVKNIGGASLTYVKGCVRFTIKIEIKDYKYRFTIYDFEHKSYLTGSTDATGGDLRREKPACGTMKFSKKSWANIKNEMIDFSYDFENQLKAGIIKYANSIQAKDDF